MHPELIQYAYLACYKKYNRVKSYKDQWNKKDNFCVLKPALPKANRKVIMFRRMMNHMGCPEKPTIVRYPMAPIGTKIIEYKTGDK